MMKRSFLFFRSGLLVPAFCLWLVAGPGRAADDPTELAALWTASLNAENSSDYAEALKQALAYQEKGGDKFMVSLRAGWLYSLQGDYARAITAYSVATKLKPTALNPLLGILSASQGLGEPAKVVAAAEGVLRVEPSNYKAQMALASACFTAQDYRKSLAAYKRTLSYYPDDTDALSGASWSAFYLGDKKTAAEGFTRILEMYPDYAWAVKGYELATGTTLPGKETN